MINKKYSGKISEKCENLEYIKMKNLICKEQYCRSFICNVDIPEPFDVCFPYVKREDSSRHASAHENTVGCSSFEVSFPSHSVDVARSSNPIIYVSYMPRV